MRVFEIVENRDCKGKISKSYIKPVNRIIRNRFCLVLFYLLFDFRFKILKGLFFLHNQLHTFVADHYHFFAGI